MKYLFFAILLSACSSPQYKIPTDAEWHREACRTTKIEIDQAREFGDLNTYGYKSVKYAQECPLDK